MIKRWHPFMNHHQPCPNPTRPAPSPAPPQTPPRADGAGSASASGKPSGLQTFSFSKMKTLSQSDHPYPLCLKNSIILLLSQTPTLNPDFKPLFHKQMKIIFGKQKILQISMNCQGIFFPCSRILPIAKAIL